MLKVVFCGTPDISTNCLQKLHDNKEVEILYVVSQPDRPSGRGKKLKSPEVVELANKLGLNVFQTPNLNKETDFLTKLKHLDPDCFVVFAFAQFLSSKVLELPKLGCFNIHTSLLPKYRGAAPIHYAILNGDTATGVSIQKMVKKMDAGDIGYSASIKIEVNETTSSLYEKLKTLSADSLDIFINKINTRDVEFTQQDDKNISFAPTIKKEEGYVDLTKESAQTIERKTRAYKPWPGVHILLNNKRCKLIDISLCEQSVPAGDISIKDNKVFLGCHEGAIEVLHLQLEGKQPIAASTWVNGLQGKLPEVSFLNKEES